MRFVLVVCVWIAFVGGLVLYSTATGAGRNEKVNTHSNLPFAKDSYRIELLPTFDMVPNPFFLSEDVEKQPSFLVLLNGREIFYSTDIARKGVALTSASFTWLYEGDNEFYIEAYSRTSEASATNAIRFRLFKGYLLVLERSLWLGDNYAIASTIRFNPLLKNGEGR